jgi:hypothetical protein
MMMKEGPKPLSFAYSPEATVNKPLQKALGNSMPKP